MRMSVQQVIDLLNETAQRQDQEVLITDVEGRLLEVDGAEIRDGGVIVETCDYAGGAWPGNADGSDMRSAHHKDVG